MAYNTRGIGGIWGARGQQAFGIGTNWRGFNETWTTLFERISGDVQQDVNDMLEERTILQIAAIKKYLGAMVDAEPGVGKSAVGWGLFNERNPLSSGHPGRLIADNIFYSQDDNSISVGVPQIFGSRDDGSKMDLAEVYDTGWGAFALTEAKLAPRRHAAKYPLRSPRKGKMLRGKEQKTRGALAKKVTSSTLFYAGSGKTEAIMPTNFQHPGFPAYGYKAEFHASFLRNMEGDFEVYIERMKREGRYKYGDFEAGETVPASTPEARGAARKKLREAIMADAAGGFL